MPERESAQRQRSVGASPGDRVLNEDLVLRFVSGGGTFRIVRAENCRDFATDGSCKLRRERVADLAVLRGLRPGEDPVVGKPL